MAQAHNPKAMCTAHTARQGGIRHFHLSPTDRERPVFWKLSRLSWAGGSHSLPSPLLSILGAREGAPDKQGRELPPSLFSGPCPGPPTCYDFQQRSHQRGEGIPGKTQILGQCSQWVVDGRKPRFVGPGLLSLGSAGVSWPLEAPAHMTPPQHKW